MSCWPYKETMLYITQAEIRDMGFNLGFEKMDVCVLLCMRKIYFKGRKQNKVCVLKECMAALNTFCSYCC